MLVTKYRILLWLTIKNTIFLTVKRNFKADYFNNGIGIEAYERTKAATTNGIRVRCVRCKCHLSNIGILLYFNPEHSPCRTLLLF